MVFYAKILIAATLLGLSAVASGLQISDIEVKGQNRIEKSSILDKISFKKGSQFSQVKATADVRRLFQTGFFYDISVDLTGRVLTYVVVEKPVIESVDYTGNRAFSNDDLEEATGIKGNELLDIKKVNLALSSIKKKYEEKGPVSYESFFCPSCPLAHQPKAKQGS